MKVFVVLALCAIASASAGVLPKTTPIHPKDRPANVGSIEGRITNGQAASDGQFPYQVALSFSSSSGGWFCGGSVISTEWVLTAAHCTSGASSVTISYGATVRAQPKLTQTVSSANFEQHASYNSLLLRNDIALIKTPAITYTTHINKIALPAVSNSYSTYAGKSAIASGYGLESDSSSSVASILNWVTLQITTKDVCANAYGTLIATDNIVCVATTNSQSTCSGDSGGPLVLSDEDIIVGLTSFGSSAGCEKNYPVGFTRITSYVDWIVEKTGIKA
ncbi:serine protease 1-like [Drosophila tropicalis]|uniref:serine protease 1-like n=1 Tax=Drosophila tropicalis TaxID=46794 RepID=UPI0035ABC909